MKQSVLTFFGAKADARETDSDTIRRIAADLDRLDPDRARYVAGFAFVLNRVAHADDRVTDDEIATMERLVCEKGHLPSEQATLVVQMTRSYQALFGATDDFLVTRELGRVASYEDKVALIDCLFAVAAADGQIRVSEGNEIARIASELRVEQPDLSRIRSAYRESLAVRQGLGR